MPRGVDGATGLQALPGSQEWRGGDREKVVAGGVAGLRLSEPKPSSGRAGGMRNPVTCCNIAVCSSVPACSRFSAKE